MEINYGIIAVEKEPLKEGIMSIVHFAGYKDKPGKEHFDQLKEELSVEEEFGLTDRMDEVEFYLCPDDVLEEFKLDLMKDGKITKD